MTTLDSTNPRRHRLPKFYVRKLHCDLSFCITVGFDRYRIIMYFYTFNLVCSGECIHPHRYTSLFRPSFTCLNDLCQSTPSTLVFHQRKKRREKKEKTKTKRHKRKMKKKECYLYIYTFWCVYMYTHIRTKFIPFVIFFSANPLQMTYN